MPCTRACAAQRCAVMWWWRMSLTRINWTSNNKYDNEKETRRQLTVTEHIKWHFFTLDAPYRRHSWVLVLNHIFRFGCIEDSSGYSSMWCRLRAEFLSSSTWIRTVTNNWIGSPALWNVGGSSGFIVNYNWVLTDIWKWSLLLLEKCHRLLCAMINFKDKPKSGRKGARIENKRASSSSQAKGRRRRMA